MVCLEEEGQGTFSLRQRLSSTGETIQDGGETTQFQSGLAVLEWQQSRQAGEGLPLEERNGTVSGSAVEEVSCALCFNSLVSHLRRTQYLSFSLCR